MKSIIRSAVISSLCIPFGCFGQNAITANDIRLDATYEHISVHWEISGDDNHNSELSILFKKTGESTFLTGAKTMRAIPESNVDGKSLDLNFHAGSAMFLEPGTSYDLSLTLTDPDGGTTTEQLTYSTKSELAKTLTGNIIYVTPGTTGGDGSLNNPYQGLTTAIQQAQAGDILQLSAGTYSSFSLEKSGEKELPIVISGAKEGVTIIDGANTTNGIITLGSYDKVYSNLILENLTIQNGKWGIDAQNVQYVTVRNCTIRDVDYGYINRRENGWESDQTITDNTFLGRMSWPVPTGSIPSERCIDLRGNNNVVRYNYIKDFADGVSTDGEAYKSSYSMDIHNNDIINIGDDIIEVDGIISNARVWRNRGINGRMGVSVAPIFGGPCYIFRNEFFNLETSPFKMNRKPAGLVIIHNSTAKVRNGLASDNGWHNTFLRNNVIMGTRYVMEEYSDVTNSLLDDWNYNAYHSTRAGTSGEPWFKWKGVRYNTINDLKTGTTIESNGIALSINDLTKISYPTDYEQGSELADYNFSPVSGSQLVDKGEILSNINDPFVTDGKPDIGAFEHGQILPHYGPRVDQVTSSTTPNTFETIISHQENEIVITSEEKINTLEIINSNGIIIKKGVLNTNEFSINTLSLPSGIYILKLLNDQQKSSIHKILVN